MQFDFKNFVKLKSKTPKSLLMTKTWQNGKNVKKCYSVVIQVIKYIFENRTDKFMKKCRLKWQKNALFRLGTNYDYR